MANRVTGTEVKTIITTVKTADQVEAFIIPANLLVSDVLSGSGFNTVRLAEIEKWLSAHFVAIDDASARESEKGVGDASASYEGKTDMRLNFTRYGQQALLLDTTGLLAGLGKRAAKVETII